MRRQIVRFEFRRLITIFRNSVSRMKHIVLVIKNNKASEMTTINVMELLQTLQVRKQTNVSSLFKSQTITSVPSIKMKYFFLTDNVKSFSIVINFIQIFSILFIESCFLQHKSIFMPNYNHELQLILIGEFF